MRLAIRKLIVLGLIIGVFVVANVMVIAAWLQDRGVVEMATSFRREFLTGTAITVIAVMLFLLIDHRRAATNTGCEVCGHRQLGGKYCASCGSLR
jgi:high-affinity Fe2+/Pb2+ permease